MLLIFRIPLNRAESHYLNAPAPSDPATVLRPNVPHCTRPTIPLCRPPLHPPGFPPFSPLSPTLGPP